MRTLGLLARLVKPGPSCAEKLAEADAANLRLQAEVARLEAALRDARDSPRSVPDGVTLDSVAAMLDNFYDRETGFYKDAAELIDYLGLAQPPAEQERTP